MTTFLLIASAFMIGVLGQVHCISMCGAIATVSCGGRGAAFGVGRTARVHAGRIGAYATQGALLGAAGGALGALAPLESAQIGVRVVAALILLAVGLHLCGVASVLGPLERLAARPLARARAWLGAPSAGPLGEVVRGFGWGLLPCGLVHGALAVALASGSAPGGAAAMVAFGLGTVPALVVVTRLARSALAPLTSPRVKRVAGLLVVLSGSVHLVMASMDAGLFEVAPAVRPCCAGRAAAHH